MQHYYGIDTVLMGVYSQLSTNCQILGYSQSITSQAAVCELVITGILQNSARSRKYPRHDVMSLS